MRGGTTAPERTESAGPSDAPAASGVAVPWLYVVLDGARPREGSSRHSLAGVARAVIGRGTERQSSRLQQGAEWCLRLELADAQVSREHVRLERSGRAWTAVDLDSRNGTRVNGAKLAAGAAVHLAEGDVLQIGRTALCVRQAPLRAGDAASLLARELAPAHPNLASFSPALAADLTALVRLIERARPNVLIRGPSGSGKELVARAIHDLCTAAGRAGPFVAVNCGALPATLVEAELFGATAGAYTGATEARIGLVRAAHGGTLFLDEVGDLASASQAALLRVLEQREVMPVGATRPVPVDLVVVSATHRDLAAGIDQGLFRADLHARLAGFELALPLLRQRREDLGLLVARLLEEQGSGAVTFAAEVVRALSIHDWPLNVRELKAALVHALALADGAVVEAAHLPKTLRIPNAARVSQPGDEPVAASAHGVRSARDARIRERLVALLGEHRGNLAAVARAMGKHRRQIDRWIERFGIDRDGYRPP